MNKTSDVTGTAAAHRALIGSRIENEDKQRKHKIGKTPLRCQKFCPFRKADRDWKTKPFLVFFPIVGVGVVTKKPFLVIREYCFIEENYVIR